MNLKRHKLEHGINKVKIVSFSLPHDVIEAISNIAALEGESRSYWLARVLEKIIEEYHE